MAKARAYGQQSSFHFRCDQCMTWVTVGFDWLEKKTAFECYQCGASVTVNNPAALVAAGRAAQAAMQTLHETMDECHEFNQVTLLGEAKMTKVTWRDG
jgi:hypothetical protein